jgi:hypothetical protein
MTARAEVTPFQHDRKTLYSFRPTNEIADRAAGTVYNCSGESKISLFDGTRPGPQAPCEAHEGTLEDHVAAFEAALTAATDILAGAARPLDDATAGTRSANGDEGPRSPTFTISGPFC